MLSIFPALLSFSLLGTALVRVLVGIIFFIFAFRLFTAARKEGSGKCSPRMLLLLGGFSIEALLGMFLFIGLFTQVAALLGAIISLDHLCRKKEFGPLLKESSLFHVVVFLLCLALLFLGPGIFAFDLPV